MLNRARGGLWGAALAVLLATSMVMYPTP